MDPRTITERILLVDGPCRGWDLPYHGAHEIHIPNPINRDDQNRWAVMTPEAPALIYRVELWRTHKGTRIFLGVLA